MRRKMLDYFFTIAIIVCFFVFVGSCFSLCAALLGRIGIIPMSDTTIKALANGSMAAILTSVPLLVMFVALFQTRIRDTQSSEDEFEQKYISLMTDDTTARRELADLYRKRESA